MASTDSVEDSTGFAQKNGATFPVLSDADKTTAKAYGVLAPLGYAKRWTFYIDPQGVVAKIDKKVNPLSAGVNLVESLDEIGAPKQ